MSTQRSGSNGLSLAPLPEASSRGGSRHSKRRCLSPDDYARKKTKRALAEALHAAASRYGRSPSIREKRKDSRQDPDGTRRFHTRYRRYRMVRRPLRSRGYVHRNRHRRQQFGSYYDHRQGYGDAAQESNPGAIQSTSAFHFTFFRRTGIRMLRARATRRCIPICPSGRTRGRLSAW